MKENGFFFCLNSGEGVKENGNFSDSHSGEGMKGNGKCCNVVLNLQPQHSLGERDSLRRLKENKVTFMQEEHLLCFYFQFQHLNYSPHVLNLHISKYNTKS